MIIFLFQSAIQLRKVAVRVFSDSYLQYILVIFAKENNSALALIWLMILKAVLCVIVWGLSMY